MDPQTQQTVEYIRQHLNQGYTEASIRDSFLRSGWPEQAVNAIFALYHKVATPMVMAPPPSQLQQLAAQQYPQAVPASHGSLGRKLAIIAGILLVLVVIVAVIVGLASGPVVNKLAQPALQQNSDNVNRKNDISVLLGGLAEYSSNYNGTLPEQTATGATADTLNICGVDCATDFTPVKLQFYKNAPAAVSFKTYASGLKVPDAATVYIVTDATCNASGEGIGAAGQSRQVAVLYAILEGSTTKQQCLST